MIVAPYSHVLYSKRLQFARKFISTILRNGGGGGGGGAIKVFHCINGSGTDPEILDGGFAIHQLQAPQISLLPSAFSLPKMLLEDTQE